MTFFLFKCITNNMNVVKADTLGYCMGVRRAVESAEVALKEYKDKKVYSLGPLIHNTVALEELSDKGLYILDEKDIDSLSSDSVVVIRAHGISPDVQKKLIEKKAVIIDATCPRVTVSQNRVAEYSEKGYSIILAGDNGHAEVEGIRGYARDSFYCVQNLTEAETLIEKGTLSNSSEKKYLLLCQTTFSPVEFEKIASYLKTKIDFLEIINTICPATRQRQDALERMCMTVDGVVVVGGKKSANTIRLYQKASQLVENVVHIEKACEIPNSFRKLQTVGITAGASTPDNVIEEVVKSLIFSYT